MVIIEKIKRSTFWISVISLSAGQIIGQVISLILMPIISRLYMNEEYGEYGIVISTATIVIGVTSLGLSSFVMVAENSEEAQKIFRVSYLLQVSLAAICCTVLLIISPYRVLFNTKLSYVFTLFLIFAYVSANSLFMLLNVYINRLKLNKVLFMNPLIKAICELIIAIPCGLLEFGFSGLIIANITAFVLSSLHMLRYDNPFNNHFIKINDIKSVIKKGKQFVFYQYPANLIGTFAAQLPNQMLSNAFGNSALGYFSMCNKVFNFPMSFIATPIQTVYFRTASDKYRNNDNIAPLTYSLVTKICYFAFIPIVIVILFGKQIFAFTLGSTWAGAGAIASILILQFTFTFCYNCITYCRVSIGMQHWNLIATVIQLILIIASLYMGYILIGTLIGVLIIYGIINTIWQIINIEITFLCLKQYYIHWPIFSIIYTSIITAIFLIANTNISI